MLRHVGVEIGLARELVHEGWGELLVLSWSTGEKLLDLGLHVGVSGGSLVVGAIAFHGGLWSSLKIVITRLSDQISSSFLLNRSSIKDP